MRLRAVPIHADRRPPDRYLEDWARRTFGHSGMSTYQPPPTWEWLLKKVQEKEITMSELARVAALEEEIGRLRHLLGIFVRTSVCKRNHAKTLSEMFSIPCPHCEGEKALGTNRAKLTARMGALLEELAMERRERNLAQLRERKALEALKSSPVAGG